jgi:hypothetical protein
MKKYIHILVFAMVLGLLSTLISCGPSHEEKMFAMDSIAVDKNLSQVLPTDLEQTFESDSLTAEQLVVFQQRGAEKLADFINYVEIISNKQYDKQLRQEVRKQIIDLFESDQALVAIPLTGIKESKPVSKFLDEIYKGGYDSIKVKTDSVVLSTLVRVDSLPVYKGVISGKVKIQAYRNKKMEFDDMQIQQARTIVRKVEKDFGGEKRSVWEVMLGEIE